MKTIQSTTDKIFHYFTTHPLLLVSIAFAGIFTLIIYFVDLQLLLK